MILGAKLTFSAGRRLIAGLASLLAMALPQAQERPSSKAVQDIPEFLKSIPFTEPVCRRDDPPPSFLEPQGSQPAKAMDWSCAISAQDASRLLENSAANLIDIRPSADYSSWHVANSMNLQLAEIVTKPYFRGKLVLLMGSSNREVESYRACMQLKRVGFERVFIIRGGMESWVQYGYAIQGKAPGPPGGFRMTAGELWSASQIVENRIFLVGERASMRSLLPGATVLGSDAVGALRSAIRGSGKNKPVGVMSFILVASPDTPEASIRELQKVALPVPLLVYSASDLEYRAFVDQQRSVLAAHARGPKKPRCGL